MKPPPNLSRIALPLLVLALLVPFLQSAASHAAPPGPGPTGAGQTVLVLDSSGSMAEPAADGQPRIDAAKSALTRVVGSLPEGLGVGMRVYGATVFDRKQPGACTDSQLVVPIGTANRPQLQAEIAKYRPFGETPIAHSLEQAGNDLTATPTDGKRQIVLVSDGEETCVPDPCPVAEKLAAKGIDLTINVVGLNVTGKARKDLQCIAKKGKGQYFDASDADSLAESLDQAAKRGSVPFQPTGEPVVGTPRSTGAPTMAPGTVDARAGTPTPSPRTPAPRTT